MREAEGAGERATAKRRQETEQPEREDLQVPAVKGTVEGEDFEKLLEQKR